MGYICVNEDRDCSSECNTIEEAVEDYEFHHEQIESLEDFNSFYTIYKVEKVEVNVKRVFEPVLKFSEKRK